MAKELLVTPVAELRWCNLIEPRHQFDKSKPLAWTCDLVLENKNKEHAQFLLDLEDQFTSLHGSRKRRAEKGFPWKADKENPATHTVVKFKAQQFQRKDGSLADGPKIIDAKKTPWDGATIGNGSTGRLAFTIYDWEGDNGCGITLEPKALQIIHFEAYEASNAVDAFGEVDGYSQPGVASAFDNEPADDDWGASEEEAPY
jgi:hypothetical protein